MAFLARSWVSSEQAGEDGHLLHNLVGCRRPEAASAAAAVTAAAGTVTAAAAVWVSHCSLFVRRSKQ